MLLRLQGRNRVTGNERKKENGINVNPQCDMNCKIGLKFLLTDKRIPRGRNRSDEDREKAMLMELNFDDDDVITLRRKEDSARNEGVCAHVSVMCVHERDI